MHTLSSLPLTAFQRYDLGNEAGPLVLMKHGLGAELRAGPYAVSELTEVVCPEEVFGKMDRLLFSFPYSLSHSHSCTHT